MCEKVGGKTGEHSSVCQSSRYVLVTAWYKPATLHTLSCHVLTTLAKHTHGCTVLVSAFPSHYLEAWLPSPLCAVGLRKILLTGLSLKSSERHNQPGLPLSSQGWRVDDPQPGKISVRHLSFHKRLATSETYLSDLEHTQIHLPTVPIIC